jgi:predicted MFS family arabinose efflux permease
LVTVFSLAYAIGSPVLATITGRLEKRRLLMFFLLLFTAANVICGMAPGYGALLVGRMIAAAGAGLFVPTATLSAATLVPPDKRGRAIALVMGGQTVALTMGVPLGTWIAITFNWRTTFWIVGFLAFIAAVFIRFLFPSIAASSFISMKERLSFVKRSEILSALVTTVLYALGGFTVYTYISDVFERLGAVEKTISIVLLVWGIASFVGSSIGGYASDQFGSTRTIVFSLSALAIALITLSILTSFPNISWALTIGMIAVILWGLSAWSFNPAQQHRGIGLSGKASGIVISLNASSIYLGSALGALFGGLFLQSGSITWLGFVGGGCVMASLILFGLSQYSAGVRKKFRNEQSS